MKVKAAMHLRALGVVGLCSAAVLAISNCRAVAGISDLSFDEQGAGGMGPNGCTPLAERLCYSGAMNTQGKGNCQAGLQICESDGSAWGPCKGETLPAQEMCGLSGDEDCDGLVNEEGPDCGCTAGQKIPCYSGPAGTDGQGICQMGTQTCNTDGMGFGPCVGEVVPQATDDCMSAVDEDCDGISALCAGQSYWGLHFGGGGDDIAKVVAADSKGNIIVGGLFNQVIMVGNTMLTSLGADDIFVAKFDKMGTALWARSFGSSSNLEEINDLVVDAADNIIFSGDFSNPIDFGTGLLSTSGQEGVVVKLSSDGNTQWAQKLGGTQDQSADSLAVDPGGSIVVFGTYEGAPDFGGGPLPTQGTPDLFLAKLSGQNGTLIWSKGFDDAYPQYNVGEVEVDTDGSIFVMMPYLGNANFGCGSTFEFNPEAFYGKFDANGMCVWTKIQGDSGDQAAWDGKLDANGGLFVFGDFKGQLNVGGGTLGATATDIWIAKFDSIDGNHQWSKDFGGSADQKAAHMAVDSDGSPILAGEFLGSIDFGGGIFSNVEAENDGFVVKLGPVAGEHKWSRHFGGVGIQRPRAVATDPDGNVLVVGQFNNSIDLGDPSSPHDSAGVFDAFVVKIAK